MDLALLGATELAGLIHDRQLAAVDLLDACIDRYSRHNPALNAVVLTRLDEARQRATAADAALADGISWGPLHGLPMTIKEAFDWEGTPSTWGNPEWADNVTSRDAEAVRRLHNAGAIIYGKTNVPLMLADWQSFNEIYGTTNNPWDLTRVPGGSSGGAAVALATGMAALELGSDIGASIRNPAHYCGVFGHKPTFGVVPTAGHTPPGSIAAPDIAVAGPLAREAADLALALDVLAGPDGLDTAGYHLDLEEPAQTRLDDFRVAVMLESPCCAQDDELTDQLQTTVDRLVSLGVTVDDKARPDMDIERANEVYLLLLRAVTGTGVGDEVYAQHLKGAVRWNEGDRSYRTVLDHGVTLNHREWWALHEERELMRLAWQDFFGDYDLLLCPTAASAAFVHDHEGERPDRTIDINGKQEPAVDQLFWAGWSCGVYLPATVAPAGLTRSGLPCGIQIVAPHLHDKRSIRFAELMSRELGGFVPPPNFS